MANNGIYYSSGNTLNFTTNNTTWATITSGGTFQMSAVSATTYYNLPPATFTGGTVSGATNFTGGLTANTISATTYLNLPSATFTGGTVSGATNFTGGLTANTISATTYQNLPFSGTVVGTGTTNYVPVWTGSTGLGNSLIQSNANGITVGGTLDSGHLAFFYTTGATGIQSSASSIGVVGVAGANGSGVQGFAAIGGYGVYGETNSGIGVYGNSYGDTGPNIGVRGESNWDGAGTPENIGGYFSAINGGTNYSAQLTDGTEGIGKVLVSQTSDGKSNWSDSLTGLTSISATTYYNYPGSSSANCVTTFFVTNISGCSPVNMLSPLNVQDGLSVTGTSTFTSQANFTGGLSANTFSATTYQNLPSATFTGGTVSGATNFTGGLTANTISATTYQNLPTTVSGLTATDGISGNTTSGNVTIINTDKGSSQNIFKNIQITGTTQFSAGSNSSDLNFSGVNITITSAATNTLVFSAATGGGGGVTSVTAGSGLSGNTTTGVITLITNISATSISDSTTVGQNLITIPNPSEIRYLRVNANNTVTAISLATLKSELGMGTAVVSTDQTTVAGGTYTNVTALNFAMTTGKTYKWRATIWITATTTANFSTNGPAGTTIYRFTMGAGGTTNIVNNGSANNTGVVSGVGTNRIVSADGIYVATATGTFNVSMISNSAGGVVVKAGSIIEYEEVL